MIKYLVLTPKKMESKPTENPSPLSPIANIFLYAVPQNSGDEMPTKIIQLCSLTDEEMEKGASIIFETKDIILPNFFSENFVPIPLEEQPKIEKEIVIYWLNRTDAPIEH